MNQLGLVVLIALGLALTAHFGLTAWRVSGGDRTAITGTIVPRNQ